MGGRAIIPPPHLGAWLQTAANQLHLTTMHKYLDDLDRAGNSTGNIARTKLAELLMAVLCLHWWKVVGTRVLMTMMMMMFAMIIMTLPPPPPEPLLLIPEGLYSHAWAS